MAAEINLIIKMAERRLAGLLFVISLSIAYASRLPLVFKGLRFGRYRPRISFIHTPLRLQDKNQYFAYYENYPLRKRFSDGTSFLPPKSKRQNDAFRNLFDDNGMIFLSPPKNDEDRLINKLLNDIIIANADKNDIILRNKKLIREKGRNLRNALRSADKANEKHVVNNVFDFNDIVG